MKEKHIKKMSISIINGPTNRDIGNNKTEKNKIFISSVFFFVNWIILVISIIADVLLHSCLFIINNLLKSYNR